MKIESFKKLSRLFNFVYDRKFTKDDGEIIVLMPPLTPMARSINDIAYIKSQGVTLEGTIAHDIDAENTVWVPIPDGHDINKCVSALRIKTESEDTQHICIRVNLN